ncbi:MAG: hypothetical protein NTW87_21110 [Planctomycetota bacterium]|nr:hypothetical protein [Planctomycetota bacterium]
MPGSAPGDSPAGDEDAATATCPACGAVLRNVRVEPGARVRCLNCGKRFAPEHGQDARATDHGRDAHATGAPRGAGYWLLRIPAAIVCAAGLVGTPLLMFTFIGALAVFRRGIRIEEFAGLLYMPLLAWQGVVLVFLTASLARVDAGGVLAAWRAGIIKGSLPAMPGSSLPYIAPLAVTGGLLPVVVICVSENDLPRPA